MDNLKKLKLIGLIVLANALVISGCGNKKVIDKQEPLISTEQEKEGGSLEHGDGYGFIKFDLDIDIDGKNAIKAEFDLQTNKVEAEFENKLEDVKLEGDQAMLELTKFFDAIKITKDTPEQEAIDNILKHLNIDAYSEFDLEVKFDEGTILDIEDIQ